MARNYSISSSSDTTTIRFTGTPSIDDIKFAIEDVTENSRTRKRLWIMPGQVSLSHDELRMLAEFQKSQSFAAARVAMVAGDDLTFGLLRMYLVFRHSEGIEGRVFRTLPQAQSWLDEPRS